MSHRGLVLMYNDLCTSKGMSCVLEIHKSWRSPVTELRTVKTELWVSWAKFDWLGCSRCTVIADQMQIWICGLHFHHFSHFLGIFLLKYPHIHIIPGSDSHIYRGIIWIILVTQNHFVCCYSHFQMQFSWSSLCRNVKNFILDWSLWSPFVHTSNIPANKLTCI